MTWEVAADDSFADDRSPPARRRPPRADGHSVHVVADRRRPGSRTASAPAGSRARSGGPRRPAATATLKLASGDRASTARPASTPPTATSSSGRPDVVVFLGDFIYEGASRPVVDGRVRSHDGPEPTDLAGYRARYAQYLSDPDLQAAARRVPVVRHLGRPRGREQLRRPRAPGPAEQRDVRRPPGRRLPGVVGAHAGAHRAARSTATDTIIYRRVVVRRPRRPRAPRRPPVPQRPGVRQRQAVDRPGVPARRSTRPARCSGADAGGVARPTTLATSTATWSVLGQQTVLTDIRLPDGAILNYDQWDGYAPARDRLLAAAAPVAGRMVVLTGDIHLAGVGVLPGSAPSSSRRRSRRRGDVPPELQPILAVVRPHRRRRARPPRLHPPHRRPRRRGRPSTASSPTSPTRRRRCRRGGRSASHAGATDAVTAT